jgi:hypothetical protein
LGLAVKLISPEVRKAIGKIKRIAFDSPALAVNSGEGGGGIISGILGIFGKIAGFVFQGLAKLGSWLIRQIPAVLRLVSGAIDFVMNFDWNASDQELADTIKERNLAVWAQLGGVAGQTVGWVASLTVGAGVSMAMPVFGSRALASLVVSNVGEEAIQEISASIRSAVSSIVENSAANVATIAYMYGRSLIKRLPENVLSSVVGDKGAKFIREKWGAEGGQSWTIAGWRDKQIEKIESPTIKAFLENFVEEAWDGFNEGLFLVADELDSAIGAQMIAREPGRVEGIELTPDREAPQERVRIYGTPQTIEVVTHQVLANSQIIGNRDVGYVGALQEEGIWIPEHQRRRLTLISYSVKQPPWTVSSTEYRSVRAVKKQVSIPNPKTGLTWSQVKQALGGAGGYESGGYYATARMSSRRKMTVYGGSESSAEQLLKELALLSEDRIQNISVGYRSMVGQRQLSASQQRIRVYPAYAITARLRQTEREEGRLLTEGYSYAEDRKRVELWRDREPADSDLFS